MRARRLFNSFKAFAMQGNVINLAVGVMIGAAFGKIVTSLVNDIFSPVIGLLTGGIDFSRLFIAMDGKTYESAQAAAEHGAGTLNYGAFLTNIIDFLIIAFCIFLFVSLIQKIMPKPKEASPPAVVRHCPFCYMAINNMATRCPHCTSRLETDATKIE